MPLPERPALLPEPLDHHSSLIILRLATWVKAALDQALEPYGLKSRHYTVLSVLTHHGAWTQLAVGQNLQIDKATMVSVVDDLERLLLVMRERDSQDRRNYRLLITDAGRAIVGKAEASIDTTEAELFAPLVVSQRRELHAMLTRLIGENE